MNFIQTAKRFLEPAFVLKQVSIRAIVVWLLIWTYKLLSVIIIQYIIKYLQSNTYDKILTMWLFLFVIVSIIFILFQNIYHRRRWSQIYKYSQYINQKYLKKIMLIDNTEYEKIWTWKIISSLSSGVDLRSDSLTSITYFLPNFLITLWYWIYLASQWWIIISIVFWIMMSIIVVCIFLLNKKWLIFRLELANNKMHISKNIVKLLMSKFEVIISNKLDSEIQKTTEQYNDAIEANKRLSYYTFFIHESIRVFINMFVIFICLFIGYYWYSAWIDISTIVWLIMIMWYIDNSAQDLAVIYKQTTKNLSSIEKLREMWDYKEIKSYDTWASFSYKSWSINIKNISFSYSDSHKLFDNFDISIYWSKKTALVWPSWWWKSTLIKLIAGYIRPDSGNIYIDGQDLSSVSLKSYYKHIWYLTQEPSVFDGSIRENLMYWLSEKWLEKSEEDIDNIIKLSKCEWIYNLKDWLDTEIGEKWIRLSGWQRQRLAIAKIMLKNPDIILLDEPTSALDSENEELVTQALNNLFKNKTVIVIAHRLQTVKHSDDIIYINNGRVLERWTHEQLLFIWWEYAKMVELQSGF